jgi:hypothetical protein
MPRLMARLCVRVETPCPCYKLRLYSLSFHILFIFYALLHSIDRVEKLNSKMLRWISVLGFHKFNRIIEFSCMWRLIFGECESDCNWTALHFNWMAINLCTTRHNFQSIRFQCDKLNRNSSTDKCIKLSVTNEARLEALKAGLMSYWWGCCGGDS